VCGPVAPLPANPLAVGRPPPASDCTAALRLQMAKLGGRAWTWLYFVPATVRQCDVTSCERIGDSAPLAWLPTPAGAPHSCAASLLACPPPPLQAASVLFAIVSLVTFANLAQVQYEETAGHLGSQVSAAPGGACRRHQLAAAFHLSSPSRPLPHPAPL
jgi:hypothetical protein